MLPLSLLHPLTSCCWCSSLAFASLSSQLMQGLHVILLRLHVAQSSFSCSCSSSSCCSCSLTSCCTCSLSPWLSSLPSPCSFVSYVLRGCCHILPCLIQSFELAYLSWSLSILLKWLCPPPSPNIFTYLSLFIVIFKMPVDLGLLIVVFLLPSVRHLQCSVIFTSSSSTSPYFASITLIDPDVVIATIGFILTYSLAPHMLTYLVSYSRPLLARQCTSSPILHCSLTRFGSPSLARSLTYSAFACALVAPMLVAIVLPCLPQRCHLPTPTPPNQFTPTSMGAS